MHILCESLEVDTRVGLVRIEVQPVTTKHDFGVNLGFEARETFHSTTGCLLLFYRECLDAIGLVFVQRTKWINC
jgi:hypothetical protein